MNEEKKVDGEKEKNLKTEGCCKVTKKTKDILKWLIIGIFSLVVIILIFNAGMFVGATKAKFSYKWAENYHKNFSGPKDGFFNDWRRPPISPGDFIEGHGIFGEIIEINDSDFVIKDRGDIEKVVLIDEDTVIKDKMENIKKDELKVGKYIVVIGSPNEQGQIQAKLIRIFNSEEESLKAPIPPFSLDK